MSAEGTLLASLKMLSILSRGSIVCSIALAIPLARAIEKTISLANPI